MSFGQLFFGAFLNAAITYVLYRIDPRAALIYSLLILLMVLTVYRRQVFPAIAQVIGVINQLGLV
ncbi:MAG: hypothetical protein MN733_17660 [Nitrososphaera sp.]|nr:hypothetical protein [Nitrososphaera sp.]